MLCLIPLAVSWQEIDFIRDDIHRPPLSDQRSKLGQDRSMREVGGVENQQYESTPFAECGHDAAVLFRGHGGIKRDVVLPHGLAPLA